MAPTTPLPVRSRGEEGTRVQNWIGTPDGGWQAEASPIGHVDGSSPPTLLLYAERDWPAIQRQTLLLRDALRAAGRPAELVRVPGQDHYTIVLTLSRGAVPEGAPRVLEFVHSTSCAARGGAGSTGWARRRRASR